MMENKVCCGNNQQLVEIKHMHKVCMDGMEGAGQNETQFETNNYSNEVNTPLLQPI